jgi:hypothetical protein
MKFQKDGPKRRRNVRRETHRTPSEFGSYHHDKHATAWSPRSCLRDHRVACYYSLGGRHPFSLTWEIEQYELELDQDRLEMQVYDEHLYSDCDDWYTDDRGYCYIDAPPLDQWGDEIEAYDDDDYYDWYREDYRDNWYDEEDDRLRKTFEEDDMWNGETATKSRESGVSRTRRARRGTGSSRCRVSLRAGCLWIDACDAGASTPSAKRWPRFSCTTSCRRICSTSDGCVAVVQCRRRVTSKRHNIY